MEIFKFATEWHSQCNQAQKARATFLLGAIQLDQKRHRAELQTQLMR